VTLPGSGLLPHEVGAPLDIAAGRGPTWLDDWLSRHGANLVAWRRQIHANPELAYQEHATTALIVRCLRGAGLAPTVLPGGTGLVCDVGSGTRCVALRARKPPGCRSPPLWAAGCTRAGTTRTP
jgi:amidohydrolase